MPGRPAVGAVRKCNHRPWRARGPSNLLTLHRMVITDHVTHTLRVRV
jgi:hypothetical protein